MPFRSCLTAIMAALLVSACVSVPVDAPQTQAPLPPSSLPEAAANVVPMGDEEPDYDADDSVSLDEDLASLPWLVAQGKGESQADAEARADKILAHARSLIGTRYKRGGTSVKTGFDCSGFVRFLYHTEAGIELPHSTRDLYRMKADTVAKTELQPGDILLFNRNGKGSVSHTGIYIGDGEFIHASSRRSGGVRIDSLGDRYWSHSYLTAKRVLD